MGDGTLATDSRKHGVQRLPSAATRIKGKPRPGESLNPIHVSSPSLPSSTESTANDEDKDKDDAPPSPPARPEPQRRPKSYNAGKTVVSDDNYKEGSSSDANKDRPRDARMTRSKGTPKPMRKPCTQAAACSTTPLSKGPFNDREWEGIQSAIRSPPKKHAPATGRTPAEVTAVHCQMAAEAIKRATEVASMSTINSLETTPNPPQKSRLFKH
ncbi:hypothetical protein C0991_008702, partial [Blastosporella zonata]